MIPDYVNELINPEIEQKVSNMQKVIEIGRLVRERSKMVLK